MFDKLLLNSKAVELEKAQMNEDSMMKSISMENTYRNIDLYRNNGFGAGPIEDITCNRTEVKRQYDNIASDYKSLLNAAAEAVRQKKLQLNGLLWNKIESLEPQIDNLITWRSALELGACVEPRNAIEEIYNRMRDIEVQLKKETGIDAGMSKPVKKPWTFLDKALFAGAALGAGYLAYLYFIKK